MASALNGAILSVACGVAVSVAVGVGDTLGVTVGVTVGVGVDVYTRKMVPPITLYQLPSCQVAHPRFVLMSRVGLS